MAASFSRPAPNGRQGPEPVTQIKTWGAGVEENVHLLFMGAVKAFGNNSIFF